MPVIPVTSYQSCKADPVRHFKHFCMHIMDLKQDLIKRFVDLNKKNKFTIPADTTNFNWNNLRTDIQQHLQKTNQSARVYGIIAYAMMAVTAVIACLRLFGGDGFPDLNKGALFILLTVGNMFSAYSQKLQVGRLEKQVLLLDILEKIENDGKIPGKMPPN